ncbi:MAG: hypothetical protein CMJ84_06730 [Planctomycetes bacterium]|nr:hypothetical protein [Planctomycetota bacterium]
MGAPAPDFELVVLEEPAAPPESGAAPAAGGEREEPAPPAPPAAGEKGEQGKKGKKDQEGEDGKKEDPEKIRLSSFKGKRAVALIFGSYT